MFGVTILKAIISFNIVVKLPNRFQRDLSFGFLSLENLVAPIK